MLALIIFAIGMIVGFHMNKETFYEGTLIIKESPEGKKTFSLEMDVDPYKIKDLDIITFKVVDDGENT